MVSVSHGSYLKGCAERICICCYIPKKDTKYWSNSAGQATSLERKDVAWTPTLCVLLRELLQHFVSVISKGLPNSRQKHGELEAKLVGTQAGGRFSHPLCLSCAEQPRFLTRNWQDRSVLKDSAEIGMGDQRCHRVASFRPWVEYGRGDELTP